jgi:tripartite-type tricarboxylate transporter receptor subunit TctC
MADTQSPRRSSGLARRSLLVGTAALTALPARAQAFPSKPVQLVVPLGPGGINDIVTRLIAAKLGDAWGQSVVVVNKPGAGGMIGSDSVAKAVPDGYTLLMCYSSHFANPSLYSKLPYDTVRDFAPVTMINTANLVLTVSPSVPVNSVQELIALAKAKPGNLNYGTSGIGSLGHLAALRFAKALGIEVTHVPYKSAPEVINAMLRGDVGFFFDSPITALPFIRSGKVKALAVTSPARSPVMPEVPTIAEAAMPGFEVLGWNGMLAPASTPRPVIDKLNADVVRVLRMPDIVKQLADQGVDVVGNTPDEFAAIIPADIAKWREIIVAAGIKLD